MADPSIFADYYFTTYYDALVLPMVAVVVIVVSMVIPLVVPIAPAVIAIPVPVPAAVVVPIAITVTVTVPVPTVLEPSTPIVTIVSVVAIKLVKPVSIPIHADLFETPTILFVILIVLPVVVDNHDPRVPMLPGLPATIVANVDPAGAFVDDPPGPGIPVPVANVDRAGDRPTADVDVCCYLLGPR